MPNIKKDKAQEIELFFKNVLTKPIDEFSRRLIGTTDKDGEIKKLFDEFSRRLIGTDDGNSGEIKKLFDEFSRRLIGTPDEDGEIRKAVNIYLASNRKTRWFLYAIIGLTIVNCILLVLQFIL